MIIQLKVVGVLLMLLGTIHILFPHLFDWKNELDRLSLINRQMMLVHTFFIALAVFLLGLLCLMYPVELLSTKLGKAISMGIGIFFGIRLLIQFIGYSPRLWKGKVFETAAHVFFVVLWGYLTGIFVFVGLG
ncbi:hypothetical protein [Flavobacterium silvaticum]|uniref:Uncharacterized protein n=1 Tax=Flavobacterium silvaticum TaxID=1852020 RepID=A0A972G0Q7_9FLAO|nr:hypothetical protein [Flavobacterium silvaticum]NMH28311.1 hypothetical protein [Flavobacterium silvaticum]